MPAQPETKFISTGSIRMDAMLQGGFPRGQIIHIYGGTDSGKSSIALSAIRCLPHGSTAVYIDAEFKFDPAYVAAMGLDLDSLAIIQTADAGEILDIVGSLEDTECLLIIDSATSIWDERAHIDEISYAVNRTICEKFLPYGGTALLISQTRLRPGTGMVPTGGAPSIFYPAMIVRVERGRSLSIGGTTCGRTSTLVLEKNRFGRLGEVDVDIYFARGFQIDVEILQEATKLGIVHKEGVWYKYEDAILGSNRVSAAERLSHLPVWNAVRESVMKFHNLL